MNHEITTTPTTTTHRPGALEQPLIPAQPQIPKPHPYANAPFLNKFLLS